MKKPVSDSWQAFVVPKRARIASMLLPILDKDNPVTVPVRARIASKWTRLFWWGGWRLQSPWGCELHLGIVNMQIMDILVTVPVRVRIASPWLFEFNFTSKVTVPVRVRIASQLVGWLQLPPSCYSPREGANCIPAAIAITLVFSASYSPREGANCISKRIQFV